MIFFFKRDSVNCSSDSVVWDSQVQTWEQNIRRGQVWECEVLESACLYGCVCVCMLARMHKSICVCVYACVYTCTYVGNHVNEHVTSNQHDMDTDGQHLVSVPLACRLC